MIFQKFIFSLKLSPPLSLHLFRLEPFYYISIYLHPMQLFGVQHIKLHQFSLHMQEWMLCLELTHYYLPLMDIPMKTLWCQYM